MTGGPGEGLDYFCNTRVSYALRGIHIKLDVLWRWEAPAGTGDTHLAVYQGSKSRDRSLAGERGELQARGGTVFPGGAGASQALERKIGALASQIPGIAVEDQGERNTG